jgi:hypothetical protein
MRASRPLSCLCTSCQIQLVTSAFASSRCLTLVGAIHRHMDMMHVCSPAQLHVPVSNPGQNLTSPTKSHPHVRTTSTLS